MAVTRSAVSLRARVGWLAAVLASFFITSPGRALVQRVELAVDPRVLDPRRLEERLGELDPSGLDSPVAAAAREFLARHGDGWRFWIDPRTERLALAMGEGVPLDPVQPFEPQVRRLLGDPPLFAPTEGVLVFDEPSSIARRDGRLRTFNYRWQVHGVTVEGAWVFARLHSGRVTQLGSRFVGPFDGPAAPVVEPVDALRALLTYSGDHEVARLAGEPTLLWQPVELEPGRLGYRLVWVLRYDVHGRVERWEGRVDATSGEVVGFFDRNAYARVTGHVYARSPAGEQQVRVPFDQLSVLVDGAERLTDSAGRYDYRGGRSASGLDGYYFDTFCVDCSSPAQPGVKTDMGIGWLDFGEGGRDEIGTGASTAADRQTFYHLNRVRRIALKWLPELEFLHTPGFVSRVNRADDECNAFYNERTVTFFRTGGGCNNTGLLADVVYHEWGHGLDHFTLWSDPSTGEGVADVVSMHLTRSPLIAVGLRIHGGHLRDLDSATSPLGLLTKTRLDDGDCLNSFGGIRVHCTGQVYGQTAWDLAQALTARLGPRTGWRESERLFFTSLPDAGGWDPDSAMSIYAAYLQADDDDGNLANGTPHAAEIHAAFARHEIAGEPVPVSEPCVRPQQPVVSAVEGCHEVTLSWSAVAGAERYEVLRTELVPDGPYLGVASVDGDVSTFVDREVALEMDYGYAVMAVDTEGCESTVEQPLAVRLPEQPLVSVTEAVADDTPLGNRSGFPDPGETVDLRVTLTNIGTIDAGQVDGTLTAVTPGVVVVEPELDWPPLPIGDSAAAELDFRFKTEPAQVSCGDVITFELTPSIDGGCAGEPSYFEVTLGTTDAAGEPLCDDAAACFERPEFFGLTLATPGASCGEVLLQWEPARTRCADAEITYDVHRGATEDFVPGPETLLRGGLLQTTFVDTLLAPDRVYHYLVRAVDSRSGKETNLVVRSSEPSRRADSKAPLFDGIVSASSGEACGEIALVWQPALESCSLPVSYEIYRSTDPTFLPSPATHVGSSLDLSFVDVALEPAVEYTYVVRARDAAGNLTEARTRLSAVSQAFDRMIVEEEFEFSSGGWVVFEPNDATAGQWAWGAPVGGPFQPDGDASADGINCWFTDPAEGNTDVDSGTTTLLSLHYDLSSAVDPVVGYARFFTNDRGVDPGNPLDAFLVHVTDDEGQSWQLLEEVGAGTPLDWVRDEYPLVGLIEPSERVRLRFTAADPGSSIEQGSKVEAGIDDFFLYDRNGACRICPVPVQPVAVIRARLEGDDVVLDWSGDPAPVERFAVYRLDGPRLERALKVGSSHGRSFLHVGATQLPDLVFYRVSAIDSCGNESELE